MRFICAVVAGMIGLFALASPVVRAETVELKLETTDDNLSYESPDYYLCMTNPQFVQYSPKGSGMEDHVAKQFAEVVKKEPKYQSETVFRGVVEFGSHKYGLTLDSSNFKKKGFDRLWFDFNHNGDLTDEKPIKSRPSGGYYSSGYTNNQFPAQKLAIETNGVKYEISFTASCFANRGDGDEIQYAGAQIRTLNYREGTVKIAGKPRRLIVLDYNSNGRFNDLFEVDNSARGMQDEVYASTGDMVLIDSKSGKQSSRGYGPCDSEDRHYLSKLLNIDGDYYKPTLTPAGDKLTLEPAKVPTGKLANAVGPYRALLYGKQGVIRVTGDADTPAAVPVGEWRLLEYQIDLTNVKKTAASKPATTSKPAKAERADGKKSLSSRLARIFGGDDEEGGLSIVSSGPARTTLSARATSHYKPVTVVEGKTEKLPFGPPLKPTVSVNYVTNKGQEANLELKLTGVAGEICSDLNVKGQRPNEPSFKILDKAGKLVRKGKFGFG